MEADPQRLKAFIEKWNLLEENDYDIQIQEQIEREHPLNMDVDVQAVLNGETLEHYELDPSRGWAIHRKADM